MPCVLSCINVPQCTSSWRAYTFAYTVGSLKAHDGGRKLKDGVISISLFNKRRNEDSLEAATFSLRESEKQRQKDPCGGVELLSYYAALYEIMTNTFPSIELTTKLAP